MVELLKHYEENALIPASPQEVFDYADNHNNFSSHMNKSSMMMAGSKMYTRIDDGKFQYPVSNGNWYQGKHPPLITKEIFDRVQEQLTTCPKSKWGEKVLPFKGLFKCGICKSNIIGEERFRKRKWGPPRRHVYYHCARQLSRCPEPYIDEAKLIKQILRYINFMNIAHPNYLKLTEILKTSVSTYQMVREEILCEENIRPDIKPIDPVNFARYVLYKGTIEEKRALVLSLDKQLYIKDQFIKANC